MEHIPEKDARRKLTPHEANRLLDSWYNKFGKVVFLVLDYGKKQFRNSDWEKITFEQTLAAPYRSCLVYALVRGGNIAVRLGPLSDGLRAIDIDIKDRVEEFARINRALQNTVIVHGRKGAQFFFRNDGKFLHKNKAVDKLKTLAGEDYGELRHGENGGAYSMIYGQHPDDANVTFRLEGDSVACLQFYQHHWPGDVILPWLEQEPFKADQDGGREGVAGAAAVLDAQLERRIKAYLDACPASIAGQRGDDRLFAAACKILGGFALDVEQTAEMLAAHFNPRCEPPWPYERLLYKARQAAEANLQNPRGYLLDEAEASQNSKEACGGEGEENEENDGSCPYPAVDWAALEKAASRTGVRFVQETIYPNKSILVAYMSFARMVCESSDTHLIGALLPVVGSLLARRVYVQWPQRRIYPNLFNLLIGPAGQRKTDAVKVANRLAWRCLPGKAFLKKHLSPEALFEEYSEEDGGLADKLLIVEDANILLSSWTKTDYGARVAAEFLDLYDCGHLSESFMRNKTKNSGPGRVIAETSTNVVLAGTFNVAMFPLEQIKQGIQRRFMLNVAEKLARIHDWPNYDGDENLAQIFAPLLNFSGQIDMPREGEIWDLWVKYQRANRALLNEVGSDDEAFSARLATAPTSVLKVAMIFEACIAVHAGAPNMPKHFSREAIQDAIAYVEAHMKAAEFIDRYGVRRVAQEQAEVILSTVRKEFKTSRPETIYLTRSQLTSRFCHDTRRQGSIGVDDLYLRILPELERQAEATQVLKSGKFEVYAFRTERE